MSLPVSGPPEVEYLMLHARSTLVAFLLAVAPSPSAAQAQIERRCRDDSGAERCAEAQQQRMRELYGVRSIEEHRDAGDQVRRISTSTAMAAIWC